MKVEYDGQVILRYMLLQCHAAHVQRPAG